MNTPDEAKDAESTKLIDPRAQLAEWANSSDEWARLLVAEVIATGRPVGTSVVEKAYLLFRQEKALDKRDFRPSQCSTSRLVRTSRHRPCR